MRKRRAAREGREVWGRFTKRGELTACPQAGGMNPARGEGGAAEMRRDECRSDVLRQKRQEALDRKRPADPRGRGGSARPGTGDEGEN